MLFGGAAIGTAPFGGSLPATLPDFWLRIDSKLVDAESLDIEDVLDGRSSCRFSLPNPSQVPVVGQIIEALWAGAAIFKGTLHIIDQETEAAQRLSRYNCEAVGWEQILERRLITAEYNDQTTSAILTNIITAQLSGEGLTQGVFDAGQTLPLVKAVNVRASELVRDVCEGSGGIYWISPSKELHFRKTSAPGAPFVLDSSVAEDVELEIARDPYRNKQTVKVTGTGGATVTVSRDLASEIAARQALEGGTGIYEAFESVSHPTSNDTVQLNRLGISYAVIRLQTSGRLLQTIRARLRQPLYRVGQLVTVDFPVYGISGTWQITRLRTTKPLGLDGLLFECEAVQTTPQQLVLDSYLRIVQAARATVTLPVANYATLETFSTSQSWNVPGSGAVELEITTYGGGGGGGGDYFISDSTTHGGNGGAGGKAISWRSYTAGTTLTITVGTGGAGGAGGGAPPEGGAPSDGVDGGLSKVEQGVTLISQGNGGGKGKIAILYPIPGEHGAPGGGTGDQVFIGAGGAGGAGGDSSLEAGQAGTAGYVEIRY